MAEPRGLVLAARRALYLAVAAVMILGALVPTGGPPRAVPPPEPLLALTLAWVALCPREVPVLSVAAVFLAADLLLQRPPGLHAALVILAAEWLRGQPARGAGLWAEWPRAGGAILVVAVAEWGVLALSLAAPPPPGPWALRALTTAALYPAAAFAAAWLLGARRPDRREAAT